MNVKSGEGRNHPETKKREKTKSLSKVIWRDSASALELVELLDGDGVVPVDSREELLCAGGDETGLGDKLGEEGLVLVELGGDGDGVGGGDGDVLAEEGEEGHLVVEDGEAAVG